VAHKMQKHFFVNAGIKSILLYTTIVVQWENTFPKPIGQLVQTDSQR